MPATSYGERSEGLRAMESGAPVGGAIMRATESVIHRGSMRSSQLQARVSSGSG